MSIKLGLACATGVGVDMVITDEDGEIIDIKMLVGTGSTYIVLNLGVIRELALSRRLTMLN